LQIRFLQRSQQIAILEWTLKFLSFSGIFYHFLYLTFASFKRPLLWQLVLTSKNNLQWQTLWFQYFQKEFIACYKAQFCLYSSLHVVLLLVLNGKNYKFRYFQDLLENVNLLLVSSRMNEDLFPARFLSHQVCKLRFGEMELLSISSLFLTILTAFFGVKISIWLLRSSKQEFFDGGWKDRKSPFLSSFQFWVLI